MLRRPPASTRPYPLFPYTTLCRSRPRPVRLGRLGRLPRLAVLARPCSHRRPVRLAGRRRRSRPAGKLPGQVQVQPPCRLAAAGRHYRQQPLDLRRVTALLRQPPEDFIRANTRLEAPPLVPEVKLHLASEVRSEEHTSELQSLMRISYAVFCLKKKKNYIKQ